ncbi:hemolysin family protein [Hansschlegelia beijingensis]|uniref:CBS domain containing-hemolysin-like protein n=1 Tax=Hansschlegelia beijingensis TaxID=1133344 RepID=A0A7W6GFE2_9HYPH|nr:hemolysin family protein [Hansschlegelia beijingensis]MBB3973205.1 CBS domain containing-hemolysin-like protein [Hansschlegelia beijingensis]
MPPSERHARPGAAVLATGEARDNWLERLRTFVGFGSHPTAREDIAEALEEAAEDSSVNAQERTLLRNVLALRETRVHDVMVHRADVVAVSEDVTFGQLLLTFAEGGHSRLPIHQGSLDEPKGMVHVKDALALFAQKVHGGESVLDPGGVDLSARIADLDLVRPVIFAPPSMPVSDLLARMQSLHIHLALVIDEYGGVDGLVTIEDLVETIVGEIEDEHDESVVASVRPDGQGGFIADARAPLDEVAEAVGPSFDVAPFRDEVDTIGGLIVTLAGRVPAPGDVVEGPGGHRLEVRDADPRRVIEVGIDGPRPEHDLGESATPGDAADAA